MRLFHFLVGFALLTLLSAPTLAQVEPGQSFSARIQAVTDGDTYDVRRSVSGEVTIRLWGVDDTPRVGTALRQGRHAESPSIRGRQKRPGDCRRHRSLRPGSGPN
jgi:endonuclease YncB( thermonuclease family)